MDLSHPPNRGEKGLSAGGGVKVDVGDEAVAGVGIQNINCNVNIYTIYTFWLIYLFTCCL